MTYDTLNEVTLFSKFMRYSTSSQGTSVGNLLTMGYEFIKFIVNDSTNKAVAVVSKNSQIIMVYPDNYHDIRKDSSFSISRSF